jgi:hypothetical protein
MTTDESPESNTDEMRRLQEEETKENCPDEYNLLEGTTSIGAMQTIELLQNTNPDLTNALATAQI